MKINRQWLTAIVAAAVTIPAMAIVATDARAEGVTPVTPQVRTEQVVVVTDYGVRPTQRQVDRALASNDTARKGSGGMISFRPGCRRATVANRVTTATGKWAGTYHTYTEWCFNAKAKRMADRITRVRVGWWTNTADWFNYERQTNKRVVEFTEGGQRKHLHYRQGLFMNTVPGPWPHEMRFHRSNSLVVNTVGGFTWGTQGDARPF